MELSVGSKVWIFDVNRRVYRRNEDNKAYGSLILRESFYEVEIVSETRNSWILAYPKRKINKKTLDGIFLTEDDVNHHCWTAEHRGAISRFIRDGKGKAGDYDTLRQVVDLIGYDDSLWQMPRQETTL